MSIKFKGFQSGGGSSDALDYKGSYNANTATPALTSALKGDFYIVSVAGTLDSIALNVGDHIVFNQNSANPVLSSYFDVIDNTDAVASVNSKTGVVVLQTSDIAENTNLYYTNARSDARIAAANLTDLNDVTYTAGAGIDNYVLTYDHANTTWKAEAPATAPVTSVNSATGAVVLQTSDIAENANLYYTNARSDARIAAADLTDLNDVTYTAGAGIDNYVLTYDHANTTWKAEAPATAPVTSVNSATGAVVLQTSDIAENTNLYYTNARSDARIAAADLTDLNDVTYTAGAGIDNYVLTYDHANTTWKAEAPATAPVTSVNSATGAVVLQTSDIAENTNLYYTNARSDARIAAADLTDLNDVTYTAGAGIDNYVLTYDHANTTWKAEAPATAPVTSVNSATGAVVLQTSDIAENTNLYYTNARSDARIAAADLTDLNDVTYTAGAGIDNYVLTYDHANTTWKAEAPATAPVTSVNSATGAVVLQTSDIAENTNLYYTNARSDARIAAADLTDLNDVTYTAGAGIDNYVLTYDHANTTWKAEAPAGGSSYTYEAKVNTDSPVTAAIDYHYSCNTSSGAITINLPALSNANKGKEIRIKLKEAGNDLTLDGNSSETIDGSGTYILNVKNQSVTLVSDGSGNWEII